MQEEKIIECIIQRRNINIAVEQLYKDYFASLKWLVLTNSGNDDDAHDVIQESMMAFVQMVQNGKFRGDAGLKTTLFGIARNIWLSKLRKKQTDMGRDFGWLNYQDDHTGSIDDYWQESGSKILIISVLDSIGELCSKILKAFYYESLSLKEILKLTNFESEQALRNKKSKCMTKLVDMLESDKNLKESFKEALKSIN